MDATKIAGSLVLGIFIVAYFLVFKPLLLRFEARLLGRRRRPSPRTAAVRRMIEVFFVLYCGIIAVSLLLKGLGLRN